MTCFWKECMAREYEIGVLNHGVSVSDESEKCMGCDGSRDYAKESGCDCYKEIDLENSGVEIILSSQ